VGIDLARVGFVIENEWYWRLTEQAQTFDGAAAVRDFLLPLARHAKDRLALRDIASDGDAVRCTVGDAAIALAIQRGLHDRAAVGHFVADFDRALWSAKTGFQFALVVPRRYELRGVLLTDDDFAALAGHPSLLVPAARGSARNLG